MLKILVGCWAGLLLFASQINAAPLADFCLSEVPASDTEVKPETGFERPTRPRVSRLDFEAGGKKYYLLAEARQLAMYQADGTQMQAFYLEQQADDPSAGDMVLHEGGWLWIDTKPMGYSAWLNTTGATPSLSPPQPITTLKKHNRCTWDDDIFFGGGGDGPDCRPASAVYSPMLKRVFLKGYERNWGYFYRGPIYQEIQDGRVREISGELYKELPELGIVLFHKENGELLFHDGKALKEFAQIKGPRTGLSDLGGGLAGAGVTKSEPSGRLFLTTLGGGGKSPLLAELLPGPRVVPIRVEGAGDIGGDFYDIGPQATLFYLHGGGG